MNVQMASATSLARPSLSQREAEVPDEFFCPITREVMYDPHGAPDGRIYEGQAIRQWVAAHGTSPIDRTPLSLATLARCQPIRSLIEAHPVAKALAARARSAALTEEPAAVERLGALATRPAMPLAAPMPAALAVPRHEVRLAVHDSPHAPPAPRSLLARLPPIRYESIAAGALLGCIGGVIGVAFGILGGESGMIAGGVIGGGAGVAISCCIFC